jgi:hypothetical protein
MAEPSQIVFSFKELAEILVREQGIHDGFWGLFVRFGITAGNINMASATDPSVTALVPTALVPIVELGIQKFEELNDLSIDAAAANPPSRTAGKQRPKTTSPMIKTLKAVKAGKKQQR